MFKNKKTPSQTHPETVFKHILGIRALWGVCSAESEEGIKQERAPQA